MPAKLTFTLEDERGEVAECHVTLFRSADSALARPDGRLTPKGEKINDIIHRALADVGNALEA